MRILRLVPKLERGEIFLPGLNLESLQDGFRDLLDEADRFPKGAHDDILDAIAMGYEIVLYPALPSAGADLRPAHVKFREKVFSRKHVDKPRDPWLGTNL